MMNKHLKKLLSLCLALSLCCGLGATAFAAEINTSGGSGSTPVNLTTTNDGIGGEVTPTKLSVVVPTVLPVAMADDGTVVTATDCKIINRSYGAVRVAAVRGGNLHDLCDRRYPRKLPAFPIGMLPGTS